MLSDLLRKGVEEVTLSQNAGWCTKWCCLWKPVRVNMKGVCRRICAPQWSVSIVAKASGSTAGAVIHIAGKLGDTSFDTGDSRFDCWWID